MNENKDRVFIFDLGTGKLIDEFEAGGDQLKMITNEMKNR
jgi:hypothetical protein